MHLTKFVHSKTGRYVMSIILGIGLASLFRTICKDKNCILFYAPPLDEIENKIFKHGDKCYKYSYKHGKCNPNKKDVEIENNYR